MSLPPSPQRCRHSPPALIDDAMSEIFLRIPPDDPKSLVRAAAVCTGWQAILSNVVFTREYRAFHGAPPMLGFLHNKRHESYRWIEHWGSRVEIVEENLVSNFVSTASFRPPACHERSDWHAIDSRHGLALFRTPRSSDEDFVICDLVTYDQWKIDPDYGYPVTIFNGFGDENEGVTCNAAVLCAKEQCNHIYCHGGPFLVVFVGCDMCCDEEEGLTFACVYSSVTRKWSGPIFLDERCAIQMMGHSAVVGNKVYFPCQETESVLEYDMGEQKLSVIDTPIEEELDIDLVGVEDGMLLFAAVQYSRLYLLSMEAGPNDPEEWARSRVINLEPFLPSHALLNDNVSVVGFAQGHGVIFLNTEDGLFTVELDSGRRKKISGDTSFTKVMPYISFCTRVWGREPASE